MSIWPVIGERISVATGVPFQVCSHYSVGGGCINAAYVIEGVKSRFFIKTNSADRLDMFEAEAAGLSEMAATESIRVPGPVCWGVADNYAFLVLEHIRFADSVRGSAKRLGVELARMHRHTRTRFGWDRNNTIGATPQPNKETTDWLAFWRDQRLGYQLQLAGRNGHGGRLQQLGERLQVDLGLFFSGNQPEASLLHGDLWSGNYGVDDTGQPVLYDPAVYYGDREADLAMTELFGGFPEDFYHAYRDVWPLDAGYRVRRNLYNLYHILNHLNLFGGGYAHQAIRMLEGLLRQIGVSPP